MVPITGVISHTLVSGLFQCQDGGDRIEQLFRVTSYKISPSGSKLGEESPGIGKHKREGVREGKFSADPFFKGAREGRHCRAQAFSFLLVSPTPNQVAMASAIMSTLREKTACEESSPTPRERSIDSSIPERRQGGGGYRCTIIIKILFKDRNTMNIGI